MTKNDRDIEWMISEGLTDYEYALAYMEQRAEAIASGAEKECIWLVEHPPLYTAGTSAKPSDLLNPHFPVYEAGRGGQYTYHGPGQRVAYIMLNLKKRYSPYVPDVRHFVQTLEQWIIDSLQEFGIKGELREGRIGIWVCDEKQESKIAALGIRIRKGVSFHGIAINVFPDLTHFGGIVPCGIRHYGVTSLHALNVVANMDDIDAALQKHCPFFI